MEDLCQFIISFNYDNIFLTLTVYLYIHMHTPADPTNDTEPTTRTRDRYFIVLFLKRIWRNYGRKSLEISKQFSTLVEKRILMGRGTREAGLVKP